MAFLSVKGYKNAYNDCLGAAWIGHLDRLKELAEEKSKGGDLAKTIASFKDKSDRSIFHFAAVAGRKRVIKYLVEELKLNVDDFIDGEGSTPLHAAIIGHQFSIAVYLLDKGANPNAADNRANTPLHLVAKMGPQKLLEYLIDKGAEVDTESDAGTPLQLAASENRKDIMRVLLDNHANPNVTNSHDLCSPLYSSIVNGSIECMELLFQAGAEPDFLSQGETPLGIAAARGEKKFIRCLVNAGADPNVPNLGGSVPIELAALVGQRESVRWLFPITSRISYISDWSIDGIQKFVFSKYAQEKLRKTLMMKFWRSRTKGEEAVKRQDYLEAMNCYTEALYYLPHSGNTSKVAALYSNRSLCWARLNKGDYALKDAQSCKNLMPYWPKAYYREGGAWMVLKNYVNAADSYYEGWKLDLKNKELEHAFMRAMEAVRERGPEIGTVALSFPIYE